MCRHPLIWLGEPDPAGSLIEQLDSDPDSEAFANVLQEWFGRFGSKAMMVRELVGQADHSLMDALKELPVKERNGDINHDRLGWLLKKNANRVLRGLELKRTPTTQRTAWSVLPVEEIGGVGRPASPPLRPPEAEIGASALYDANRNSKPHSRAYEPGEVF